LVAASKLGRELRSGETVHHVNGDKQNNDPDNIEVLPSQSPHARLHFTGKSQDREHVRKRIEAMRRTIARKRHEQTAPR
jgi:hypothetical protein